MTTAACLRPGRAGAGAVHRDASAARSACIASSPKWRLLLRMGMRLPGRATPDGTAAYARAHAMPPGHYREAGGLTLSSVGHGSYLGTTTDDASHAYEEAALACLQGGINVLDTASNYRDQRSERDVGRALQRFVRQGGDRSGVLVATKAGFLHGDADSDLRTPDWFAKEYALDGTVGPHDIVGHSHCLKPEYLSRELDRSRDNIGIDTVDVFFVHNPETQLAQGVPEDDFYGRMRDAFTMLERRADAGDIKVYGVATWDGLRAPPGHPAHLGLLRLVHEAGEAAQAVGRKASQHRFRAVELPVNMAMTEALLEPGQPWRMAHTTVLDAVRELGMVCLASASLMQARLVGRVQQEWKEAFGTPGDLETCLQFTRSVRGVTTALVGMGRPAHAREVVSWAAARAPDPGTLATMVGPGGPHG